MSQKKKNVPNQDICPRPRNISQTIIFVPDQGKYPRPNKYPCPDETPTCPRPGKMSQPRYMTQTKECILDQDICSGSNKMSQTKKNVPALMGHQNGPGQCICPRQRYMSQTKEYVPDQENVPDQDKCDVPGQNKYPFPDETPTYCRLGKISQTEIYDPD